MFHRKKEDRRTLRANDQVYNQRFHYADNLIKTSKYSLLTFIPLNLYEQFQSLAKVYFLGIIILQFIPQISSVSPVTTGLPLCIVVILTGIKNAYNDWQHYKTDKQVNNRKTLVVRRGEIVEEKWHKVQVGDIIKMENNRFVAADTLLLSSSNPSGLVYIETADLDGETNLKVKYCLEETNQMGGNVKALSQFHGEINCEPPNVNLSKFEGSLLLAGQEIAVDNKKVVYRGAVLRNTPWCYGLVIFAGKDTKLMQNTGKTKLQKRTHIDKLLNRVLIGIVISLALICLAVTLGYGMWEVKTGFQFQAFLPWSSMVPRDLLAGAAVTCLLLFPSYIIVFSTILPISLYVSLEVIRLFHSKLIDWDQEMYDPQTDTWAKANATNLNEELGQIQYIFSDKTGTLTKNIMTFNKCSIYGRIFGEREETGEPGQEVSSNRSSDPSFEFYDRLLLTEVETGDTQAHNFFRLLSLCHTVMPHREEDGSLSYQAQSPDEHALVSACSNFGFVFTDRSRKSVTLQVRGRTEVYELLSILDFSNERRRLSVIVKHKGKIKLYTKGADDVILARLAGGQDEMVRKTEEDLYKFATEGLRTLVLAERELSHLQYDEWQEKHSEAAQASEDRDDRLDRIYDLIETDLTLVGATAIEDKLQDGVPHTIANLQRAGIKIWVLTGDKLETAINIGYSCNLLSAHMTERPFIVEGRSIEDVTLQLQQHLLTIRQRPTEGTFALVITGHSLELALTPDMELTFLSVAEHCQTVVCCRVTPLQKALVVELIKKHKKAVALAIGDGANDVAMIKAADVGVGISGQEGMQAVLAADYSLSKFMFLERLLLVHGRWSYFRICKFLSYFFYKNFAFVLSNLWYAFFCAFSAQILFDDTYIACYNLFHTNLPIMMLACFEQDVSPVMAVKFPQLYQPGIHSRFFNSSEFSFCALKGFITPLVIVMISVGAFMDGSGQMTADHYTLGSVVGTILVILVTTQIALDTWYWTVFNFIAVFGSVIFYISFTLCLHQISLNWAGLAWVGLAARGSLLTALADLRFWLTCLLVIVVLEVPVMAWRFAMLVFRPSLTDYVRLLQSSVEAGQPLQSGH